MLWSRLGSSLAIVMLLSHCADDDRPPATNADVADAGDVALSADAGAATKSVRFGPLPPQNAGAAPDGFATQHGDTAASDSTPLPGPGAGLVRVENIDLPAVCPSVLVAPSGQLLAVCTELLSRAPAIYLLDGASHAVLATRRLAGGSLFGGVYPYLDAAGRVVVVDGANQLLVVEPRQNERGQWDLSVEKSTSLAQFVTAGDSVVGLAPGYDGHVWFATAAGTVGTWTSAERVATLALTAGEQVANSIATAPEGTAVVTDHALYLLRANEAGEPYVQTRAAYDRGPARKPGQLSHGSGSTPTFFGPQTGSEYLALTDNAQPTKLLVFHSADPSTPLCTIALPEILGSENSPIGSGRSVIVASTYGYPYPALPAGAEPSEPASAPLSGGLTHVVISEDAQRCAILWNAPVRSSAVPKLSLADGLVYTFERTDAAAGASYAYVALDAASGAVVGRTPIERGADTLQLAGTIAHGRALYQGVFGGIVRIAPSI